MDENVLSLVNKIGINNLADLLPMIKKVQAFIPKIKSFGDKIKAFEDSLGITPEQKIIYAAIPIVPVYTGNETPEEKEKLDAKCEIRISVIVINSENKIVDEKFTFNSFDELDKIISYLPVL